MALTETNNFFEVRDRQTPIAEEPARGQLAASSALVLLTAFSSGAGLGEPLRDIRSLVRRA